MTQISTQREPHPSASIPAGATSGFSYPQHFERLGRILPYSEALIISSVPRGGLQVTQAAHGNDALLRSYIKGMHALDRVSWQTIIGGQALSGQDACGKHGFDNCSFRQQIMSVSGFAHIAAARIRNVILPGYDGVLQVYRKLDQEPFSAADLQKLASAAKEIETGLGRDRESRSDRKHQPTPFWAHRPAARQFIFDHDLNELLGEDRLSQLDDRLRHQIVQHARQQLQLLNGQPSFADRLQLPDSRSDLWTFRVSVFKSYPALSDGPVIFFCLQPTCGEWSLIRQEDFQADADLSRLIPSMKFMRDEFQNVPTLDEIAKLSHLSPYHFHRQFSDLMGLTPKHFMLECQIQKAKSQLAGGEAGLPEISKSCGFSHQSHFTSRFKQATGLTPTRWRRMIVQSRG
ncbi:MAG: helix-turn-helix transcriptional regulator [Phycisphaerales bacterium]|nr:helix-turn-helix transcriptional regulator [Phycisphaerales bacterium]